jgi:hypothetical protein
MSITGNRNEICILFYYLDTVSIPPSGTSHLDTKSDVSDGEGACRHVVGAASENDVGVAHLEKDFNFQTIIFL